MPRKPNSADTVQITVSVTPQIKEILTLLSQTGFWGKNAADTASEILKIHVRDYLSKIENIEYIKNTKNLKNTLDS